jgi:hypothetical protein
MNWDAQADNLPSERALSMLADSIASLKDVRFVLQHQRPSTDRRAELRRQLSGVLADVEIVRQAIKE